jgi:hypothetical protein
MNLDSYKQECSSRSHKQNKRRLSPKEINIYPSIQSTLQDQKKEHLQENNKLFSYGDHQCSKNEPYKSLYRLVLN